MSARGSTRKLIPIKQEQEAENAASASETPPATALSDSYKPDLTTTATAACIAEALIT